MAKEASQPNYTLIYFDARGRAELIRMILAEACIEFEDKRIHHEDWPEKKSSTPFGKLPLLLIDDKPLAQSLVIARYLAREHDLEPSDPTKIAFMDAMICTLYECIFKLPFMEKDEKKKKQIFCKQAENELGKAFEKIEKLAKKHESTFLSGENVCYGDLAILNCMQTVECFDKKITDKFPRLKQIAEAVSQRPRMKEYLKTRPDSKF